ncbi:MAG: Extensin-like protein [Hyphomicrobiales bacterium]|nr:Extensin-like protein [Hyphomicrobiales bacterium]
MKHVCLIVAACAVSIPAFAAPPLNPPLPPPRPAFEGGPRAAFAKQVPLPPPRPNFEGEAKPDEPPAEPPAPAAEVVPAPAPAVPAVCAALASGRAIGVSLPAIPGDGGCGVASPVRLTGVRLRSGATLKLSPDATVNCEMAGHVADFLDGEVARIESAGMGRIVEVRHAGAYECRGTNRVVGAKLSEHARGNAIDLRTFKFKDGHTLTVGTDRSPAWSGVKAAACERFGTILGPGSDPTHTDHLHLDMRARRSKSICQWVLD